MILTLSILLFLSNYFCSSWELFLFLVGILCVPCGTHPARVDVRVGGRVIGWMAGCSDLHNKDLLIVDVHNKDFLNDELHTEDFLVLGIHNKDSLIVDLHNKDSLMNDLDTLDSFVPI